jgi:hypothetical protein
MLRSRYFSTTIDLPKTANGYTLSWIRYTRTVLDNVSGGGSIGATFTTKFLALLLYQLVTILAPSLV